MAPSGARMNAENPSVVTVTGENNPNERICPCNYCDRVFTTNTGAGLHMKRAHPVEFNARLAGVQVKNRRWSDDERTALALYEVAAVKAGITSGFNAYLKTQSNSSRTIDAIGGQRRSSRYREIFSAVMADHMEREAEREVHASADNAHNDGSRDEDLFNNALRTAIQGAHDNMSRCTNLGARSLAKAAKASLCARGQSDKMMKWLNSVLVRKSRWGALGVRNDNNRPSSRRPLTRGQGRKQRYAYVQKLYRRDERKAAAYVLQGSEETVNGPSASDMFDFWGKMYSVEDRQLGPIGSIPEQAQCSSDAADKIWAPVTEEDIVASELHRSSAAGPDGVTVSNWRAVPRAQRALFYNLLMYRGKLDADLNQARTVFIPKINNPSLPGDYRPISITSVVIRQLHKILANRLQSFRRFDIRQRAFCRADGLAENLLILKSVLKHSQQEKSELHMASIDLRKAFDSIAHGSVLETIRSLGCPEPFVNYLAGIYGNASTILQYNGSCMRSEVKKGVLQGDPLSPALFNYVMDRALAALSKNLGYSLGNTKFNCIAYADDVILLNGSKIGLQLHLMEFTNALRKLGLEVNPQKSWAFSHVPLGKLKQMVIQTESNFHIGGMALRQIGILDTWKYLGVHFKGMSVCGIRPELMEDLAKVSNAPLKPQQRLRILKIFVLSKYTHSLVLGNMSNTALDILDATIRKLVRSWLHFPHDVPTAYIHAPVRLGGLGVPCLAIDVPMMRFSRLVNIVEHSDNSYVASALAGSSYYSDTVNGCRNTLIKAIGGVEKTDRIKYWETELESRFDTMGLKGARHCRASSTWVSDEALSLTGRDYIHYHHIRAGCLPSRVRRARGRDGNINCRGGCGLRETNYHIIQQCCRTHGGRVLRHNRIVEMIYSGFRRGNGLNLYKEPTFHTFDGLRKPDLILTDGHTALVVDVQITRGDNTARDRSEKISKYQSVTCFTDQVKRRYRCSNVVYEAITISYKGIFEKSSIEVLRRLQVDSRKLFMMATSVLYGSWLNWVSFNKMYWRRNA